MPLKILHLSDIHFKHFSKGAIHDLDKNIQNELELDLEAFSKTNGKIDLIIIGGDIAFSGRENEYKEADVWLEKICKITGCNIENVLTVPGNHDIDRGKVSLIVKDVHDKFRELKNRNNVDTKLLGYLNDPKASMLLLDPLTNYNSFAQKYDSIPDQDNMLFWEKEFRLDCALLRVRGVNSAIISDESDHANSAKLILGSTQSNIMREKGVINMVVCHHPPDWLYDGDDVKTDFKARTRLQLFGHKHKFDAELVDGKTLVLSAGAMQPSRSEDDWEPRYNIIDISIPTIFQNKTLVVNLYKRTWKKATKKFGADFNENGEIYEEYKLSLDEIEITPYTGSKSITSKELKIEEMGEQIIDLDKPDPTRRLAYLFLGLPYQIKIRIAVALNLIDDGDANLNEIQKAGFYLKRAVEKKLLKELWAEIAKVNEEIRNSINPFKS